MGPQHRQAGGSLDRPLPARAQSGGNRPRGQHDGHYALRRSTISAPCPGTSAAPALLKRGIVRVDRKTPWGNPYPIGKRFGSRADVIERYRQDLWRRIRSGEIPLEELAALANRELACWCSSPPPSRRRSSPAPPSGQPNSSATPRARAIADNRSTITPLRAASAPCDT